MKKLILFLMLLPLIGVSQDFFTEWKKYLADCNELVNDTVIQKGTVNCELVPVKMNGKIVSYSQTPKDTIWHKCECRDYATDDIAFLRAGSYYNGINTTSGTILDATYYTGTVFELGKSEPAKNTFSITRKKICTIKKRQAGFPDFMSRWCVDKKLIEFN